MIIHRSWFLFLLAAALATAWAGGGRGANPAGAQEATITIVMEDCKASRPGRVSSGNVVLRSLLFSGPPREDLVKRGSVEVAGQRYTLYLPRAKAYSVRNTAGDSAFENTSTAISIAVGGDDRLSADEIWFASQPLPLGDRMFEVVRIAADGSRIVLKASRAPMRGVLVGRSCPAFSFKTADGKEVSRESLAGKPFLLDIWSIT